MVVLWVLKLHLLMYCGKELKFYIYLIKTCLNRYSKPNTLSAQHISIHTDNQTTSSLSMSQQIHPTKHIPVTSTQHVQSQHVSTHTGILGSYRLPNTPLQALTWPWLAYEGSPLLLPAPAGITGCLGQQWWLASTQRN